MKINIGTYEVDIKVKREGKDRCNAEDVKAFLNEVASAYYNAAEYDSMRGVHLAAKREKVMHDDIFNVLDAMGYYDAYKEG